MSGASLTIVGLLLTSLGILIGWIFGMRQERATHRQYQLDASSFAVDWLRDFRAWAEECINVLSEAAYICKLSSEGVTESDKQVLSCCYKLSALIDRGRFFLPNIDPGEIGTHKPAVFRGLRHPALDYLVAAERMLNDDNTVKFTSIGSTPTKALVYLKRGFVSIVQEILDPRERNQHVAELLEVGRGEKSTRDSSLMKLLGEI